MPNLPLGLVTTPRGKAINLSVSPGAGAFRLKQDPEGRIWTITDRGPAIDCNEEKDFIGTEDKQICLPERRGKIYPLPGFAPSIYSVDISAEGAARFTQMIPVKGKSGKPVSGIPNALANSRVENAYALDGRQLDLDPSGIEPGGIVKLSDGTFWITDEFAPSVLEVAQDGTILRRIVPVSQADDYLNADYPIQPTLPAIMGLRQVTRGFDGLAVSPDEAFLYVAMQSTLANPDLEAYRRSPAVRIWKLDRISGAVIAEFVYPLEPPEVFTADQAPGPRPLRQSDVRISEIVAVGQDRLLVLERIRYGSRIFHVDLAGAVPLPERFDLPGELPTLEQLAPADWAKSGVQPLTKRLLMDSALVKGLGGRLSAMALMSPRQLLVLSNNDTGIEGGRPQMFRLTFNEPVLK